jgi:hypothetical protein
MRTLHVLPVIYLGVIFAAACTSNIADDGCGGPMGGGAPDGGAGGHPTDGGCISPTEGEACSSGEVACQPPDPCCTGYEWFCMAGTWQKAGLGCACTVSPPFACGTTTCSAGFYCEDHPPGIAEPDGGVPSDAYTCSPLPAACAATPTCACIEATLSQGDSCSTSFGAMCTEDASGNITIVCLDA